MGLLDDAIREHLELKRQHGADPSEVARQEHEAFGAGQRAPDAGALEPAVPADLPDLPDAPEAEVATPGPVAPPPEPEAIPEPPVVEETQAGSVSVDRYEDQDDVEWTDPQPATPDHDPTAEAEEPASEDVLEETPDFLQETPEHDRLWFEQRPPRDFDF